MKKLNKSTKLANIKRYTNDYLNENCKSAPLQMKIHLNNSK